MNIGFYYSAYLHSIQFCHISPNTYWKSPVCVTPEAQVPLTLESKFRMTPIKS